MAESNVIGLVIAVILFVMILLVGLGAMNRVQGGIFDIWKTGDQQQEQLEAGDAIAACNNWVNSPNKYSADAILDTFKIPDKMRPFGTKTRVCWEDSTSIKKEALDNKKACAQNDANNCNGGYLKDVDQGSPAQSCINACLALISISNLVDQQCAGATAAKKQAIIESTVSDSTLYPSTTIATIRCS